MLAPPAGGPREETGLMQRRSEHSLVAFLVAHLFSSPIRWF